jgi:putative ABC transport system permease protein
MPLTLELALKSLRNRALATILTVVSIALSIALLVGVENVRVGIRESFTNTIRGTDLIVGARGGSMQLLLYSVFGMGSPTGNISYESYEHWKAHPAVAWTIPYSLGDSHRSFRVIGTTDDFYERFRYRRDSGIEFASGRMPQTDHEVVLGSEVADRLGYNEGDEIAVTHGLHGTGIMDHEENPFRVVGILARTFTPIDRSLYVTLEGITAMHEGFQTGVPAMPGAMPPAMPGATPPPMPGAMPPAMPGATPPPMPGASPPATPPAAHQHSAGARDDEDASADRPVEQITSFFVGTRNRADTPMLLREINTWEREPLMAIMPGLSLAEMFRGIGFAEDGLRIITIFVVIVGLLGMLVSLYSTLNARRREMAILRAVGAGPGRIISLLVLESGLLAIIGSIAGVVLVYAMLLVGTPLAEQHFGLHVPIRPLGETEFRYIAMVVVAGFLIGLVPAIKAYRNSLADGLSVRL